MLPDESDIKPMATSAYGSVLSRVGILNMESLGSGVLVMLQFLSDQLIKTVRLAEVRVNCRYQPWWLMRVILLEQVHRK